MTRGIPISALIAMGAIAGASSCERSQPASYSSAPATSAPSTELRTVEMTVGSRLFTLEVAESPDTQQLGLMHRTTMPADHGMIFVFPNESPRTFWMKDTLIPLDIVYLSATGKVVNISHMKALDETGVPSGLPAKYAIELNLAGAADVGVRTGDLLHVPTSCRNPRP